ncbi:uncharacterized protein LOC114529104 [Dendronephthya gigantea]|uniref:uncharacterized protein LOC114529104 n=1 Tax=Dendronephthya gigantea TaxID=151771 RepID=UPI00106ADAEE|nr:uncharacterized protein LOC114529104 [Dendronephthya gigantea]
MEKFPFHSRRSPVICLHGVAASSNALVSEIGTRILHSGGNAVDACVAMAAALNVTEPCSTGIGGDCFCLFYEAQSKKVRGLNGSGRSGAAFTLDMLAKDGVTAETGMPPISAHTVTVPGAAAGWVDSVENFGSGKLSLKEILQPAITLAEEGFPVSPITAEFWSQGVQSFFAHKKNPDSSSFLINGRSPSAGEVMKIPHLANTFKTLAEIGKDGFYKGCVAQSIVDIVNENGGRLTLEDLGNHSSTFCDPISTTYEGIRVWEIPPNSQGITVLLALNILKTFPIKELKHNSSEYIQLVSEALRLAFADSFKYCADPEHSELPVDQLLSEEYGRKRASLIEKEKCVKIHSPGTFYSGSDTVYFTVADNEGNACSFINSNFCGFGTGLVPCGCGFTLQNRGLNFSLERGHANCAGPNKRPYHTIIPGLATYHETGELYASFGVMGGFMQPQGHVQILLNMIHYGMDPQEALDKPRFQVNVSNTDHTVGNTILLEQGISRHVAEDLRRMGYNVEHDTTFAMFGRGQIIQERMSKGKDEGKVRVYWAGSDPRADGMAMGF